MKQDELTRGQNSKGPMKQGPVEKGQNGSGLSGIRPNWLRSLCTNGPGFDSQSRRHMCIWFPVHTCFRRFSPGTPVFPPASKTGLLK